MSTNINLIYETKRLMTLRYPRFASEIADANIEYKTDLKYHTAATDGKNIYFDPKYLESLSEDDRLFLIAHELMHIKFNHQSRLLDRNGQKRDMEVWNEATDAIINANLERDGFKIKEGYINRPEALNYSSEEFYEILLKEKQNNQNNNQDGNQNNNNSDNQGNSSDNQKQHQGDDHSLWEEAFEQNKENNQSPSNKNNSQEKEQNSNKSESSRNEGVAEKTEFEQNREERRKIAKESLKRMKNEMLKEYIKKNDSKEVSLGEVGESASSIDWRLLLRREIDKSETIWSQRRSIAENNYAYRLEENDIEDDAETEVMIDVSGSVDLDLVRAFLRMLKPLLKESKLRVGCFNEKYWGMVEVKTNRDIDNFVIPQGARGSSAWTEDWDLAVRSFTKKREINKIVFTDGDPCPGTMPKDDLKNENIIWLVYGNKNFKPCCGKVINLTERDINKINMNQIYISKRSR